MSSGKMKNFIGTQSSFFKYK